MELHTIGIDLGKTVFHLVGLNLRGKVVVRKKFSRKQLLHFTANLQVELIGMEACGGAHFLGRALREQGHEVRLMPAQYVKPYVKTNKTDYIDAEAIAEAVGRPKMRFVPIKSDDQLDLQSLHRVRERWVMRRTAVINQIRGLLLERGITLRKGRCYEIANQQQPEVHAWRQARPSHDFRIEWLTVTFDEIIEVVLGQPLIQSRVEWVTGGRRKIRRRHPHFRLPLADAFSHEHVQSVVREIEINPVDPYTRTGGCHANHAHAADRSDHRGITRYWPRNRAEAR